MTEQFHEIPTFSTWSKIKLIDKGWSGDKKYYIETENEKRLLLRISAISEYNRKQKEFHVIQQVNNITLSTSKAIDFGTFHNDTQVYSLFTWVDGDDAEVILPTLTESEQYNLGVHSGEILKQLHELVTPKIKPTLSWSERFNNKINRNIKNYNECAIKFQGAEHLMEYIELSRHLLHNRSETFQHGDYHVGNMVINNSFELGIIDFNRFDYGDPWEEFNRITFCVAISKPFAVGRIHGYFNNLVPDSFFRLLALYIGSNQLSSIPWATTYGQKEVDFMIRQANTVMEWYDNFKTYIPNWYTTPV